MNPAKNARSDHLIRRARCVYSDVRLTASTRRGSSWARRCSISSRMRCSSGDSGMGSEAPGSVFDHDYRNDPCEWKGPFGGGSELPSISATIQQDGRHGRAGPEPPVDPVNGALHV